MEALDQSVRWLGIGAVADTVYGVGSVQERSDAEGTSPALFLYQLRGTEASCLLRLDMEDDLPRLVCGGRTYAGLSLHRRASE